MPTQDKLDMHDPADKELHTEEGVAPYPLPSKTKVVGKPQGDEATSTPDNNFERATTDEDGEHLDAVDKMQKTLIEDGDVKAWKKGKTRDAS